MTYAISDIHGCYDKYTEMLQTINFSSEDTLYILGDMIDRGPDGFKIMLDAAQRPNVVGLMGNHEAMAIEALAGLMQAAERGDDVPLYAEEADAVELWFYNGGGVSLTDFLGLQEDQIRIVWEYMNNMPLYREVSAGDRQFVLVHGGLGSFDETRPLDHYTPHEILWHRPAPDTVYYANKYTVFGHTPVQLLGTENANAAIYHRGKAIDIDCGCVFPNGRLGCLCLDTMEEFYV